MKKMNSFLEFVHEHIKEQNLDPVKNILQEMSTREILEYIFFCNERDQAVIFRLMPREKALEVFELMDAARQGELLESLTTSEAMSYITELDPDEQVRLFDELPDPVAYRLLEKLPRDQHDAAANLMTYEDGTVGRIMSPVHISVSKGTIVEKVLQQIRKNKNGSLRELTTIYVIDETKQLLGVVPLSVLVAAEPNITVDSLILEERPVAVAADSDQEKAARLLQQLNLVELPVTSKNGQLIGVLTVEDAMDVIREEITDDMYDKVGLLDLHTRESDRSHKLIHGSFWHVVKVRVPFLLITLAGGMLAGAVIDRFEEVLEAIVAVAVFIL